MNPPGARVACPAGGHSPEAMMSDERLRYRVLTGPDNAEFCRRISDALDDGYVLHGSPAITYDPEQRSAIVAQALVLDQSD